jgi:predicted DCC family thiol-disulfide oxidoreductase YuxK
MKTLSPWQFTFFRILFGSYLSIHFAMLVPYAAELFSRDGLIGNPALNPTAGLFPNPLALDLPPVFATGFVLGLCGLALLFTAGFMRPLMAGLLWFGWSALFHRNNLIANPSLPYIGLMLALCVLVPRGEPWSLGERRYAEWAMPKWVFRTAWILLAVGYLFSGLTKLYSESWVDGSAMTHLLMNPLARPGIIRDGILALPEGWLKLSTWLVLAAELSFAPLALWRCARPWAWLLMVLLHLGIVAMIDFADLSFGMLIIHVFTFDPRWLRPLVGLSGKVTLAFDGECLLCSRLIRFLADEDMGNHLIFTTLQGKTGQLMEGRLGGGHLQSMVVEVEGQIVSRSTAVLRLLAALGGHWRLIAMLGKLLPRRWRDMAYDLVAAKRHQWFPKPLVCELPTLAVTVRLLTE